MKNKTTILIILFAIITISLVGCKKAEKIEPVKLPEYDRPLPEGAIALVKITDPAQIPDFTFALADTRKLTDAILNSLSYLSKPSSQNFFPYANITHDDVVASLEEFAEMLDSGLPPSQLNQAIRAKFDVYTSVGWDMRGTVLFTGYYTPIFNASKTPTAKFRYPLYKRPKDLVSTETGIILGRKTASGQVVKFPSRKHINSTKMLKGTELVYLSDPFEVYICHVQGSAILKMPYGELLTVGYDGNNGYDYVSVGKQLIADRRLPKQGLSLQTMIDFFKTNPHLINQYINVNPRFVFFRFAQGNPRGSLNEEVIPKRSIATDKEVYPRAALTFVSTRIPKETGGQIQNTWYTGFALDQDTGGAIRAPGRCDIYMGIGPKAGQLAGHTYQEGRLYYLFLKK